MAFDTTQITSPGNYSRPKAGNPCHPLAAGAHPPAIAFQPRYARNGRGAPDTVAAPLTAEAGRTGKGDSAQCVAFTERTRPDGRNVEAQAELSYALTNPGNGGRAQERRIAGPWGVRRLTPTECERLQAFPDHWTAVNEQSDSTRYRQLGNAVCVNEVEWIGRRLLEILEAQ